MSVSSNNFLHLAAPGVQALQPYLPGKPVAELEREYGISNIIKLASNENPFGPSPLAVAAAGLLLAMICCIESRMSAAYSGVLRAASVSSERRIMVPPCDRTNNQL